jgi:guanyl-specific ribonuclease Sa
MPAIMYTAFLVGTSEETNKNNVPKIAVIMVYLSHFLPKDSDQSTSPSALQQKSIMADMQAATMAAMPTPQATVENRSTDSAR